jgi:hypothetical protein
MRFLRSVLGVILSDKMRSGDMKTCGNRKYRTKSDSTKELEGTYRKDNTWKFTVATTLFTILREDTS